MALYEVTRRVANTEIGKGQLEYERAIAMMDAYGGMYLSMHRGRPLNRMGISCRMELKYNIEYGSSEEWDDEEDY